MGAYPVEESVTYSQSDPIIEELKAMKQRMDVLFDETLLQERPHEGPSTRKTLEWGPSMDVWETSDMWVLEADLPGVRDEDVSVQVRDGALTISGVRSPADHPAQSQIHVSERPRGAFHRSFVLPRNAVHDCIEARFESGVLTVKVPRKPGIPQASRKVPVRSE